MNPLFSTVVGSKLYGISVEGISDTDFKGFGFEEIDEIIGLKTFEQQSYKNDILDGPDKIEGTIYSTKRYLELCMKGNPTVIEISFANEKYWHISSKLGNEICKFVQENFMTKHLFRPYSAYHKAQMHKMQSMERTGNRKEMCEKYGYDVKFCSHAFRLARQCCIVMEEGTLRPTLDPQDKEICLNFRNGKYSKEEALKLLTEVDTQMYDCYKSSKLPELPDFNKVNKFLIEIYKKYIKEEYPCEYFEEIDVIKSLKHPMIRNY